MISLTYNIAPGILKRVLTCITIVSLTFSSVNAQSSAEEELGHDWPAFLGPHRDGRSAEKGLDVDELRSGMPLLWEVECGNGYAACSVRVGQCFVFDGKEGTARLRCLDAQTGELAWTYSYCSDYEDLYGYDSGPRCTPVLDEDVVYLFGVEGQLHCVNIEDGQRRWMVDVMQDFGCVQNFFGVGSTPLVHDNLLLVVVGGSSEESSLVAPGRLDLVEPDGSAIVAFNKLTGEVVYKTGDDLASYGSIVARHVDGRDWAFALLRSGLLAFDPGSGRVDFSIPWRASKLESVNASTPVVSGNSVFFTECYAPGGCLISFTDEDYQVVWRDERTREQKLACHWCTPVFDRGFLYGCHGQDSKSAELRCVRWQDGQVMWTQPDLGRSSLIYVDGHLVCLAESGELTLIKATAEEYSLQTELRYMLPDTGTLVPSGQLLKYPAWNAPVLSRGRLYVRGKDRLVCSRLIHRDDRG